MNKKIYCKNGCGKMLKEKQKKFCSLSCTTSWRNKNDNPMNKIETREKMIAKKIGCAVWNEGLTKEIHPSLMECSERLKIKNPMFIEKNREKSRKSIKKYYKEETAEHKILRVKSHKVYFIKHPEKRLLTSLRIKKAIKENKMWWQSDDEEYKKEIEHRVGRLVSEWIENNPEKKKEATVKAINYWRNNPEKHPIKNLSHRVSFWQKRLYLLLCCYIDKKELKEEFFIKTKKSYRFADIAWEKEKIDFEYDGYRHSEKDDKKNDKRRDKELKELGWKTVRFNFDDFRTGSFENKIIDILKNGI